MSGRGIERTYHFSDLKNRVPGMREMVKKNLDYFFSKLEKNRVQQILGLSFFFKPFLPYVWDPFLTFFSTRVLETHLGWLKAACIGPAISKGEQGTAELGANTVLKQTNELCF